MYPPPPSPIHPPSSSSSLGGQKQYAATARPRASASYSADINNDLSSLGVSAGPTQSNQCETPYFVADWPQALHAKRLNCYIIDPSHYALRCITIIVHCGALYNSFYVPFVWSFVDDQSSSTIGVSINILSDLIYFIEIMLTFFIAYNDQLGNLVYDPTSIRLRYIYGRFTLDIITIAPIDWMIGSIHYRINRLIRYAYPPPPLTDTDKQRQQTAIWKSLHCFEQLIVFLHIITCGWYALPDTGSAFSTSPVLDTASLTFKYVYSFLWALAASASFGILNGVHPETGHESAFAFFALFTSTCFLLQFQAQIGSMINERRESQKSHIETTAAIWKYCRHLNVPRDVANRIVESYINDSVGCDLSTMIAGLSVPLRADIAECMIGDSLNHLNNDKLSQFIETIVSDLVLLTFEPGQQVVCRQNRGIWFVKQGEIECSAYLMNTNEIDDNDNCLVTGILSKGHVFWDHPLHKSVKTALKQRDLTSLHINEAATMNENDEQINVKVEWIIISTTYSSLYFLDQAILDNIETRYHEQGSELKRKMHQLCYNIEVHKEKVRRNRRAGSLAQSNQTIQMEHQKSPIFVNNLQNDAWYEIILSVHSSYVVYWSILVMIVMLYNLFSILVRLVYINDTYVLWMRCIDLIGDAILWFDFIIRLRVARKPSTTTTKWNTYQIYWLGLTIIPLDIFEIICTPKHTPWLRFHRLLRLPQLLALFDTIRLYELNQGRYRRILIVEVIELLLYTLMVLHIVAVSYFSMTHIYGFVDDGKWLPAPIFQYAPWTQQYGHSLFMSSNLLFRVGTNVNPSTVEQTLFTIVVVLAGITITTCQLTILGAAFTDIALKDSEASRYANQMLDTLRYHGVSSDVLPRVARVLASNFRYRAGLTNEIVNRGIPVPTMLDIMVRVYGDIFRTCPLFACAARDELIQTFRRVEVLHVSEGEFVFRRHGRSREMYFLVNGRIRLLVDPILSMKFKCDIEQGEYFGAMPIFSRFHTANNELKTAWPDADPIVLEENHHEYCALALSSCTILAVGMKALQRIVQLYPKAAKLMAEQQMIQVQSWKDHLDVLVRERRERTLRGEISLQLPQRPQGTDRTLNERRFQRQSLQWDRFIRRNHARRS